jgi:hypothetical protein
MVGHGGAIGHGIRGEVTLHVDDEGATIKLR